MDSKPETTDDPCDDWSYTPLPTKGRAGHEYPTKRNGGGSCIPDPKCSELAEET